VAAPAARPAPEPPNGPPHPPTATGAHHAAGLASRRHRRPRLAQLYWLLRDYAKRVWDNAGEDNVFFLAGGIAFNILLAVLPFALLLITGVATALNLSADKSTEAVSALIDRLLPSGFQTGRDAVHRVLQEAITARGQVGVLSAVTFVWFSTRLFGSLRAVLAEVFDIEQERSIVAGKVFDILVTIVSMILVVAYSTLSAYLAIGTSKGVALFQKLGVREDVIGGAEYWFGRVLAFSVIVAMFYGLYKYLPIRRVRWQTALLGAMFTGALLELAKAAFSYYIARFNPGSLYTGTLAVVVIVVFWVYYAALIFILGGEVAQVYELRRTRRLNRAALE
jgi:membrane protein